MYKNATARNPLSLKILEVLIALIPFILYLLLFSRLSDKVPVHYGADNLPNRWAPKVSFDALLICALGFFCLLFGMGLKKCVVAIQDTPNVDIAHKIMTATELFLTALFSFLGSFYVVTLPGTTPFPRYFILRVIFAGLSLLWIATGYYLPRLVRNRVSGIRTQTPQKDESAWLQMQRFGGKNMARCGIVCLILACCPIIPNMVADCMIVMAYVLLLMVIVIYSVITGARQRK